MKNILIFFTLTTACAQENCDHYLLFSNAFDVRNLIIGSKPTNYVSGVDCLFQFTMVSKGFEVSIGYETFNRIQLDKYTLGVGYHLPIYICLGDYQLNLLAIYSLEPTLINRWGKWGGGISYNQRSAHLTLGANFGLRLSISDHFALECLFNVLPRVDSNAMYGEHGFDGKLSVEGIPLVGSSYLKMIYKVMID